MDREKHWQAVYETKRESEVSWYAPHLAESLRLIREVAPPTARIIDVGGGASTLVDDLLAEGYRAITVLDIAEAALSATRKRLGEQAAQVSFVVSDVTRAALPAAAYDVWHDRAVFHFLTEPSDRRAYLSVLQASLAPDGYVVMATFSRSGPQKCSGLPVARYDAASLQSELGSGFVLETSMERAHVTPAGREQQFLIARFRRSS